MPASPSPARSRAPLWRAIASFVVIGLALLAALSLSPRLGLDLEGGTQIVLETQDSARVQADRESTDRALEVLRGRVDALGVAEPTLARAGERRIIVELPGVQDPREAARVIGRTAQLGFHVVRGPSQPGTPAPAGTTAVKDEDGQPILVGPLVLDGNGVKDASAELPQDGVGHVGGLRRLQRPGRPGVARAGAPGLRERGRWATDRDPARQGGDLLPRGPAGALLRCRVGHPDHRSVHPAERRGPGDPDQGRRPPGAGRGDRAAHRRRHARRRRDRRVRRGRDHRHRADRPVHRRGLPADGPDGDAGAGGRTR